VTALQTKSNRKGGILARGSIDWWLVAAIVPLLAAGLVTMHSFVGEDIFFQRQLIWISIGLALFFLASVIDWRFLRRTSVVAGLFATSAVVLLLLFVFGTVTKGALSRFDLGAFFVQPSDPIKLVLIVVLAKYFSRRHIEIARYRHIIVSGLYAFILFVLVFLQGDFGSAVIMFLIWLGMVLVSGIPKRHFLTLVLLGVLSKRAPALSAYIAVPVGVSFYGWASFYKNGVLFGHQIHWLHVAGINLMLILSIMWIVRWLKPMKDAYVQKGTGEVDLTFWRGAKVSGVGIILLVVAMYVILNRLF